MDSSEDVIDLAPSPWRAHAIVLGILATAFAVFTIAVWPHGDHVQANLGRVVVMLYGVSLALFGLLTTGLIALFRRHRSPVITSYAIAVGLLGVLLVALLGRP
jgi:hypothetical protein